MFIHCTTTMCIYYEGCKYANIYAYANIRNTDTLVTNRAQNNSLYQAWQLQVVARGEVVLCLDSRVEDPARRSRGMPELSQRTGCVVRRSHACRSCSTRGSTQDPLGASRRVLIRMGETKTCQQESRHCFASVNRDPVDKVRWRYRRAIS